MTEHNALRAAEREADTGPRCLFERIGGREVLIRIVSGVYDLMRVHPESAPKFEKFAKTERTFQRLKDKTVEYLEGEWGGTAYDGPDLFISHSTFGIPVSMFDAMLKMFRDVLTNEHVVEPELSEVLKSIDKMRGPMCDPGGTFAKDLNDRLEKLTKEREERIKYYKEHNIPYSRVSGWALKPDPKAKAKAKADSAPMSAAAQFTLAEVRKNSSQKSSWIVVGNKVYDVTSYMKDHPGGAGILKSVAGKDASKEFHEAHKPSQPNVNSVMKRLLIGSLAAETAKKTAPVVAKSSGGAQSKRAESGNKRADGDGLGAAAAGGRVGQRKVDEAAKSSRSGAAAVKPAIAACSVASNFSFHPEFDGPPDEPPSTSKSMFSRLVSI